MSVLLKDIISSIKAEVNFENTSATIDNVSIDSRSLQNNHATLFFALVGPNHDAHIYIEELVNKGIRYFVVNAIPEGLNDKACFLKVEDTLKALQDFASYYRGLFHFPEIGITGSNGKTIIKEWLNFLLAP